MCVLNFDQVSIVICIHLESSLVLLNHLLKKKEKKSSSSAKTKITCIHMCPNTFVAVLYFHKSVSFYLVMGD